MTKDALVEQIMVEVGDPTGDAEAHAQYESWFDDVLEDVLSYCRWPFRGEAVRSVSIAVADSPAFALSNEIAEILDMRNATTRRRILPIDPRILYEQRRDLTETSSDPEFWFVYDYEDDSDNRRRISFYPLPSANMTLSVFARLDVPTPLAGSATIPVPHGLLGVLREGVRAYAYEGDSQHQLADRAWQRYDRKLEAQKKRLCMPFAEADPRLRPDGDIAHARARHSDPRLADRVTV